VLPWIVTIILVLLAGLGWLALKKKVEPIYSIVFKPINLLWLGGSRYHHIFNVLVNVVVVVAVFSFYKFALDASNMFSIVIAILAGVGISGGKEMLDKYVQLDDVIFCVAGILIGGLLVGFCLW
jgi:glycopeptide antibiotics resistance protein